MAFLPMLGTRDIHGTLPTPDLAVLEWSCLQNQHSDCACYVLQVDIQHIKSNNQASIYICCWQFLEEQAKWNSVRKS